MQKWKSGPVLEKRAVSDNMGRCYYRNEEQKLETFYLWIGRNHPLYQRVNRMMDRFSAREKRKKRLRKLIRMERRDNGG